MKNTILAFALLLTTASITTAQANESGIATAMHMPDGQLQSHMVRVYTNKNLGDIPATQISLRLFGTHGMQNNEPVAVPPIHPIAMDNNHAWEMKVRESTIQQHGTLLLFDLADYPIPDYMSAIRVRPELSWCGNDIDPIKADCYAIGEREIYLANSTGAYSWAAGTLIFLILLIGLMSANTHDKAIHLICDARGKISLSRTQMALWTLAIGGVVTAFGLARFEVPEIPVTLLALMGASLLTTGISYNQSEERYSGAKVESRWYDLISDGSSGTLSLARAQMVFWTVITLGIFVSKSILDGALWQVPVELVGLMGMSQLAYLAPKLNKPAAPAATSPPAAPAASDSQ